VDERRTPREVLWTETKCGERKKKQKQNKRGEKSAKNKR